MSFSPPASAWSPPGRTFSHDGNPGVYLSVVSLISNPIRISSCHIQSSCHFFEVFNLTCITSDLLRVLEPSSQESSPVGCFHPYRMLRSC